MKRLITCLIILAAIIVIAQFNAGFLDYFEWIS